MKGSDESIKQGVIKLLPVLDNQGRAILYGNPALASADDEVDSQVIKVWWYLMHVALANPSVQKNGFVQIINMNDLTLRHFKPKRLLGKLLLSFVHPFTFTYDVFMIYSLYNIVLLSV